MLLQKTLVQIEGLGRALYPDLDLWETGQPVLKAWVREQSGPRATLKRLARDLPDIRYTLERLPAALRRFVEKANTPASATGPAADHRPAAGNWRAGRASRRRAGYALVAGSVVLLAGALMIGLRAHPAWPGWLLLAAGLATLWMGAPSRD
jgi:ubiquinone biosynthesis protein